VSKRLLKRLFHINTIVLVVALGIFAAGVITLWAATIRIPDLDTFDERIVQQSTKIYDRTGEILLFDVHENVQRTVVPFEDISHHIKNATVAIEDAEFYKHGGVKISSTVRAILTNILHADVFSGQGGSTITQQVVKNSLLTPEKLISRKLKEWVLAIKLEGALSKEEILELYLNEVPYGGNIYGVQEASRAFFAKDAQDLILAESAYLAALPQAPTFYSPYGNNRDALEERKNLVLRRMLEDGFITQKEYDDAAGSDVTFQPRSDSSLRAPHFVMFIREYLEQKYGRRAIEERGLRVITTLDYSLQEQAEEIVKRNALSNAEKFNAENAGLVAVDPKTGQVLVMVGSRDYFDKEIDGNFNVTLSHRQPGSSFKPFVYATAFKRGYTPETVVFDLQTEFSTECSPFQQPLYSGANCYHPKNYDNVFRGPVSFRNALAQSINVPAVKVLYLAGIDESLRTARDLGITSLTNRDRYGLTLVLGGGEVSPIEMASAYSVFANDGVRNQISSILKIEDKGGNVLERFVPRSSQALDTNIARQITNILSDNTARTPAFGEQSYLYFPERDVAAKTGTTNDYRDAWIVGYTPNIAAAAWAGNNDNSPMEKKVAGFIVAPMWNEFMKKAIATLPEEQFVPPKSSPTDVKPIIRGVWEGSETYAIDSISKKLATEYTPAETQKEVSIRSVHSILRWVDKDSPLGPLPNNPEEDPQYSRWEEPVRSWALSHGLYDQDDSVVPKEKDDIHVPKNFPRISVSGLNETYSSSDTLRGRVSGFGKYPIKRVEFYLNDQYVLSMDSTASFSIPLDSAVIGKNQLRVVGIDSVYNRDEESLTVYVEQ